MSAPKIVVYKKIVEGDWRKFSATSNDAPTGGGARDLRFSPAERFLPIFERMFPSRDGFMNIGQFSWPDGRKTDVKIAPPTNARPKEMRICSVNECILDAYLPTDPNDCILLIVCDDENNVWPSFITASSLREEEWDPVVKREILGGLNAIRHARVTPMGYLDFEHEDYYTNGTV